MKSKETEAQAFWQLVDKIYLCEDEDGSFPTRIHRGHEVSHVRPLRIHGTILELGDILPSHNEDTNGKLLGRDAEVHIWVLKP
jgi:hypothetical protein